MLRILLRNVFDLTFSVTLLATVIVLLLIALDPTSGGFTAHLWARELGLKTEDACPTIFGKAFWFSCADEVRTMQGPSIG